MATFAGWVLIGVAGLLAACTSGDGSVGTVTAADLKKPWPLTVPSVKVHCVQRTFLLLEAPDGKRYALIGGGSSQAKEKGWLSRREIWAPHDTIPGLKRDIGELVSHATDRCVAAQQWS